MQKRHEGKQLSETLTVTACTTQAVHVCIWLVESWDPINLCLLTAKAMDPSSQRWRLQLKQAMTLRICTI